VSLGLLRLVGAFRSHVHPFSLFLFFPFLSSPSLSYLFILTNPQSYTTAVSATPAPSGTILDYSEYQASVNSAIATQGSNAALDSGAKEGVRVALWGAVCAGVVGVGAVLLG
jgi:hypothetical protein